MSLFPVCWFHYSVLTEKDEGVSKTSIVLSRPKSNQPNLYTVTCVLEVNLSFKDYNNVKKSIYMVTVKSTIDDQS